MPCALAVCAAFRAGGHARPASPLYPTRHFVVSVSGHGGVPPWPSPTKLSRSFVLHRGHASRSAPSFGPSALRAPCYGADRPPSPLCPSRCVVVPVSGNGRVRLLPGPRSVQVSAAGGRESCHTRPLRAPASLLHIVLLPSVFASHCAKAPFGVAHRLRALRVKATGRYAKWPTLGLGAQSSALPGRIRALRAAAWSPL